MLHILVKRIQMTPQRLAGALKLKFEYAKRIQCKFLRRNRDLSPIVPCFRKLVTHRQLTNLLGAAVCLAATAQPAFPGEDQPAPYGQTQAGSGTRVSPPATDKPTAVPESTSGMMIFIDPETGAFLKEPAPGHEPLQLTPELQNALSTSDSGLVEVQSSVPGGGVMLDLQGRFQNPLIITIDANGKLKTQHLNEMTEPGGKK